jgi:PKHD-type hydroxylase
MYIDQFNRGEPVKQGTHIVTDNPAIFYREVIPSKLVDLMVEELDEMERFKLDVEDAGVGGGRDDRTDHKIRNSKLVWWDEAHWACSIMSHYIGLANKLCWEYDLSFLESIQVSMYEPGGHYTWHSDYGTSYEQEFTRKLSASLLVSEPSTYIGGDLEFIDYHGNHIQAPKEKGTIIVFDSRVPHRVTPVTHGKRTSLVTWMYGPKLK